MRKMAKPKWDPGAFQQWYQRLSSQKQAQAWNDLSSAQRKLYGEWQTFQAFVQVSGLDIDPRSIENCDPNACAPPLPDIRCLVNGQVEYFELGEVTDQKVAQQAGEARKHRQDVYGGFFSQTKPLVRIFLKKCRNHYTTHGHPLHLLLHFAIGHQTPFEPALKEDMGRWSNRLIQRMQKSQFDSVWVFDEWESRVLVQLERHMPQQT